MVDLKKHPDAGASVKKEVCIQKALGHPHILRFFGQRSQGDIEYIFLEYAAGGELFDRIGELIIIIIKEIRFIYIYYPLILQNRTWACPSKRRSATSSSWCPAWSTCTCGGSPIGTWSQRTCCWTTMTILRYPTLAWRPFLGIFRYSTVAVSVVVVDGVVKWWWLITEIESILVIVGIVFQMSPFDI